LLAAARAIVEYDGHESGCQYKEAFSDLWRMRGTHKRATAHAAIRANAPPCNCAFGRLAAAVAAFPPVAR
jgi:hypothetical protein